MQVCGRDTPFASDDFVTTGWCNALWRFLAAAALGIVVLVHAFEPAGVSSGNCSIEIDVLLFVAFALVLIGVLVDIALAVSSGRGSMPQEHKRAAVPVLFALHLVTVLGNTLVAGSGLYFVFSVPADECEDVLNQDNPRWVLLQVFCWVTVLQVLAEYCVMTPLAVLAAAGRPDARDPPSSESGSEEELAAKAQAWSKRCNLCTGCLCGRSAFSKEGNEGGVGGLDTAQTLAMVGRVMASTLAPVQSQRLTLSDIVGGMLLLRSVQKHIQATGALGQLLVRVSDAASPPLPVQVRIPAPAAQGECLADAAEELAARPAAAPSAGAQAPPLPISAPAPPQGTITALAREVLPRSQTMRLGARAATPGTPAAAAGAPGWDGTAWCDVQIMAIAAHYSVFMCAAYGWQLYTFEHTVGGCCALGAEQLHSCVCREAGGSTGVPCSPLCACCCCGCKSCADSQGRVQGDCSGLHKPAVALQMRQLRWSPLLRPDVPTAFVRRLDALKSGATVDLQRPQEWGSNATSPWTLLYASWEARWLVPSFLVMYDRTTNALVLVVRGTLSIEDCITDAAAVPFPVAASPSAEKYHSWLQANCQQPAAEAQRTTQHTPQPPPPPSDCSVPEWARDTSKWYAHEGMWHAAEAVVDCAVQAGVFSRPEPEQGSAADLGSRPIPQARLSLGPRIPPAIVDALCGVYGSNSSPGDSRAAGGAAAERAASSPHSPRMMVIGHSLGAATASLLGMMLKASFPETQVVAFSPPLALVSPALSVALRPCLTSVTLGKDIVARMTVGTMRRMFTLVGQLLPLAAVSKHRLVRNNALAGARSVASRHCGAAWCAPEDDDELQSHESDASAAGGQRRFVSLTSGGAAAAAHAPGGARPQWLGSSRRLHATPPPAQSTDRSPAATHKRVSNPHAHLGDDAEGVTVCGCATHATSVQTLFGSNWRSARQLALQLAEQVFQAEALQGVDGLPLDPAQAATQPAAGSGRGGAAHGGGDESPVGPSGHLQGHTAAAGQRAVDILGMELWMPGRTVHLVPVTPFHAEELQGGAARTGGGNGCCDGEATCSCSRSSEDSCRAPLVPSHTAAGTGAEVPGHRQGLCRPHAAAAYAGMWSDQRDFTWGGIQVSSRMVRDHLPDRVRNAVLRAWDSAAAGAQTELV